MRRRAVALLLSAVSFMSYAASPRAAFTYPKTFSAEAKASNGETTITSTITIRIDRLIEPARRTRVIDGLKYNGYQGFMNALKPLPVIGTIGTKQRSVNVRYAWETKVEDKQRLIVVADTPLFFLPSDQGKARAGYELTFVELILDDKGTGRGTLSGAARVKPSPDEGVVLEDFAAVPVTLTVSQPPK